MDWFITLESAVGAFFGAILGVWLKHILDSRRENVSRKKSDIDILCKDLDNLTEGAARYWSDVPVNKIEKAYIEGQIRGGIHRFEVIINELVKESPSEDKGLKEEFIKFRKLVIADFGTEVGEMSGDDLSKIWILGRGVSAKLRQLRWF